MSSYVPVAKRSDIRRGRSKSFTVKGKRIAVFNDGEDFHALDNTCAHARGSLGRGHIKNGLTICPVHGYVYDAKTGACRTDARLHVNVYEVAVKGDTIEVKC